MIPIFILQTWLFGLLSLGMAGGAIYCGYLWQQRSWTWDPVSQLSVFAPTFAADQTTLLLAIACVLTVAVLFGGVLVRMLAMLARRKAGNGEQSPQDKPVPTSEMRLRRPDGSELHVEFHGPEEGVPIVLTHGWGLHSAEWNYLIPELATEFRIVVWDEPGLGRSTRPANRDYSIENLARDLEAVLATLGDRPAILLGHSIGGMIILTFCRLFQVTLGERVVGLVLAHTTPTDPVKTTSGAALYVPLERPVLMPLMYLTIALSPIVWVMNWLSYLNGSAHLSTMRGSFGGTETWEEIEFATRFQVLASPAVIARGMLGMMRYDAISTLPTIPIPALVVIGDKDSTTKPEAGEMIRRGIPECRLERLSPAKHLGLIEHHAAFAEMVRRFVRTTADGTFQADRAPVASSGKVWRGAPVQE